MCVFIGLSKEVLRTWSAKGLWVFVQLNLQPLVEHPENIAHLHVLLPLLLQYSCPYNVTGKAQKAAGSEYNWA